MITTHETVTPDYKLIRFNMQDLAVAADQDWVQVQPDRPENQAIVGRSMRAIDIRQAILNGPCGVREIKRQ